MEKVIDEFTTRKKRLKMLEQQGIDCFPATSERNTTINNLVKNFSSLFNENKIYIISGRIIALRSFGKAIFGELLDATDKIQFFANQQELKDKFNLFQYLDVGDIIEVKGKLFLTKKQAKTVLITEIKLLTKCLRPLPAKWHGLTDVEKRFRQRYLDLIKNPICQERFIARSKIIETIRQFLISRGYLEVDTPILQPIYGGGLARPFKTHHQALNLDMYLRISDELYLKRLIVGGLEKIFEFCKDFRNEGMDLHHNPEFTMLEIMTAYQDYFFSMDFVEEIHEYLLQKLFHSQTIIYQGQEINFQRPWKRLTMLEAVNNVCHYDFSQINDFIKAKAVALRLKVDSEKISSCQSIGEILALIFSEKVESQLIQPTIIYNFPVEVSPLAKKCLVDPRYTQRFEHFIAGHEQGNHYSELNDPIDLKQRFINEQKKQAAGQSEAHQTDDDFLEAIEHGMPPVTGIGIGIDRLVMLLTNTGSIKEVILFPTMKPK